MTPQESMLAAAFEGRLATFEGTPEEFLQSIPNSVNLKATDNSGVWSIQVLLSMTNIILVETNGKDVLVTSLT